MSVTSPAASKVNNKAFGYISQARVFRGLDWDYDMMSDHIELGPQPNLTDQSILDMITKINSLRELGLGTIVALPQIIVVGDQSSGKSSLLESLTGFPFPRDAGLCTRFVTQITCKRDLRDSKVVTIIPGDRRDQQARERLKKFRYDVAVRGVGAAFQEAAKEMGIRTSTNSSVLLPNFSEDTLLIDISGPQEQHLTVIDVPGIFRSVTPGSTTTEDIELVKRLVTKWMREESTIILAVIPSNIDIATTDILQLAKEADPAGNRTMGVLTKPDLVNESRNRQVISDLVQGKANPLKLGYHIIKNRGADDNSSTLPEHHMAETRFFQGPDWSHLLETGCVGIQALKEKLRKLLGNLTARDFPRVRKEFDVKLKDTRRRLKDMGQERSDEGAQRLYLMDISSKFRQHTLDAIHGRWDDPIFSDNPRLRLITKVRASNAQFSAELRDRAHTWRFDKDDPTPGPTEDSPEPEEPNGSEESDQTFSSAVDDDLDGIIYEDYPCKLPVPEAGKIGSHLSRILDESRGPELGTFGSKDLSMAFKEQTKNWEPIVLSHVSAVIVQVHEFLINLLSELCPDEDARSRLWESLLEKFQEKYTAAMSRAVWLLNVERLGIPITENATFDKNVRKQRDWRVQLKARARAKTFEKKTLKGWSESENAVPVTDISSMLSDLDETRNDLYDKLQSYYMIARERFVDVLCQQVIYHDLLYGPESPLFVFSSKFVLEIETRVLDRMIGETAEAKRRREETKRLEKMLVEAAKTLRM